MPPPEILRQLGDLGCLPPRPVIQRLHGGRTNRAWRLTGPGRDLVLKLYARDGGNPLFPNDPAAEAICLSHPPLAALAPRLMARGTGDPGAWVLYPWVEGPHWAGDMARAARALRALHRTPAPAGLRRVACDPATLIDAGARFLDLCAGPQARQLSALCPDPPGLPAYAAPVLLHGDPVAANIVIGADGPVFIDWQCPAIGDPCADIAILLSPAMRILYRGGAPRAGDRERFFASYGDAQTATRYHALAPLFHWRMAAYCLWRAGNGAPGYSVAAEGELSALAAFRKSSRPMLT
jgi:aminoglycoside phosphotransferase (APT) family kinase protein